MTHECSTPQELADFVSGFHGELWLSSRKETIVEAKDRDGNVVFRYKKVEDRV